MSRNPGKPSQRKVNSELKRLRAFIECPGQDPIEQRLAQVAENAIIWATKETDWSGPMEDVKVLAAIIKREIVHNC